MTGRRLLVVSSALVLACEPDPRRVGPDLERMREQPRYDLFERSEFFADRAVMQEPPMGTVPRERALDTSLVVSGGVGGVPATYVPFEATPALLARGADRFAIFCAVCHGAAGFGGSIVGENLDLLVPSLQDASVRALPPGAIYRHIVEGPGRMPAYAGVLNVHDRWAVVAYVRELQRSTPADAAAVEDAVRGERIRRRAGQ